MTPHRMAAGIRLSTVVLAAVTLSGQESVDRAMVDRIRQEALERSAVLATFDHLVTVVGPRLTGSPAYTAAAEWARQQFERYGLKNAALEPWEFGRGWELERFTVELTAPRYMPLIGYPEAWSASTPGEIEAAPVFVGDRRADQIASMTDRLKGAIVLTQPAQTEFVRADRPQPTATADPVRIGAPPMPGARRPGEEARRVAQTLRDAGAAVVIRPSAAEHGTMFVLGRDAGAGAMPSVILAAEHYNMIVRMLAENVPVRLRVNVQTRYFERDRSSVNVLAEIPGTDPRLRDEVVLVGGHLDSWHSAPGATDNADGAAVVLEAARVLAAIGAQPRRTIRFALWGGEEQGLLGSRAYVARHLAGDANQSARDRFAVYLNIDPGTGPVYGFYLQGQTDVKPVFDAWLEPFKDLGARRNIPDSIGSTDHLSFTAVGLPGFNPIQDYTDYDIRTHHTNADTFERVQEKDLKQAAAVFASFAWHAAQRDAKIPRPAPSPAGR